MRRILLAAVALALVTGGCDGDGGSGSGAPSSTEPSAPRTIVVTPIPVPPGIRLSFIQQRIDEGTRRAQVRVVNGNDRPLRVRAVGIDWAGYPLRLQRAPYLIGPKQTVDLRYLLPPAVCTAAAGRAPITGVAVTRSGTIRQQVEDDGVRFLTRIRRADCDTRRLAAAVAIRYADAARVVRSGDRLHLRTAILLRRLSTDRPIQVAEADGSVLFELRLPGRTVLPAGRARIAVPLDVTDGGRCDPHSRGQSTQTFLFRVWLRLGNAPAVPRIVEPTKPQQTRLLAFLSRACRGRG